MTGPASIFDQTNEDIESIAEADMFAGRVYRRNQVAPWLESRTRDGFVPFKKTSN